MPSNQTPNYGLCQWEAEDKVQRTDFNADNAKIDAALKAEADARAAADAAQQTVLEAHGSALTKLGNCQIYTDTYVGANDGSTKRHEYTFPHKPVLVMAGDLTGSMGFIAFRGMRLSLGTGSRTYEMTWNNNTVTWYCGGSADGNLDYPGRNYMIFALLDMAN